MAHSLRRAWGLDSIVQDVRYAVRGLRRSPVFTATAVTTLALGIGLNATAFTITNAVLFKKFSLVHENDRILYLASRGPGHGPFVSYPDFEDWRAQSASFDGMGAVNAVRVTFSDQRGAPETYRGTQVSANTFRLLGVRPVLGRDFTPADEVPGAAPVAILSDGLWTRRYARDPAIIGQSVRIDGTPATIIGVMARGFSFPRTQDLWLPLAPAPALQRRDARGLWFVFGRMAPSATLETARADMETIGRRLADAYPATNRGLAPAVQTFHEFFVGPRGTVMYAAMSGAVGLVLLIACANVAHLLLGRTMGRSREIAVRVALGAGPWRIVRQFITESLILAAIGGVLGWGLATGAIRVYELTAGPPDWFDRALDYSMDYRVVGYLIAMSVGAGVLFGLAPASRLATLDVNATVKDGGRGAAGGSRGTRLSALLVTGEMALAVVLLTGAGVLVRSVVNISRAEIGVKTDHVLTAFVELPPTAYPTADAQASFYDRLTMRLSAIPSVESIALADRVPTQGARLLPYEVASAPASAERTPRLPVLTVGPAYFETLGAVMLAGRAFNDFDRTSDAPVAIVNERFAHAQWPGEDPLGKRIRLFDGQTPAAWRTIVGVAPNIVQSDMTRQAFDPLVYLPLRQQPTMAMWVMARTAVPPETLVDAFRREAQALDPDLPLFDAMPLTARLAEGYRSQTFLGSVFTMFAAMALVLASVGLYGVVAHGVSRRTQEFGVRMAVGATAAEILALVFKECMRPLGAGLIIGLAASLAVNRLLQSELVHVSPADPLALALASTALLVSAALGCWIPARRAMRVDPVIALRHE